MHIASTCGGPCDLVSEIIASSGVTRAALRMICPSCSSEMSEESRGGVRLDLCSVCFGVWFDGGELETYQAGEGSPRLNEVPSRRDHYRPTGDSAHVKCPRCEHDILRKGIRPAGNAS